MSFRAGLLMLALAVAGCGFTGGGYPSLKPRAAEAPRVIEAPGAGAAPALSAEEQAALTADLAREVGALDAAQREIDAARAELEPTLGVAGAAVPGSAAWSAAQMALSRFDLARAPLDDIDARLAPLLRQIDSLPADHPDRQAVESLAAAVGRAGADAERQAREAGRRLGGA